MTPGAISTAMVRKMRKREPTDFMVGCADRHRGLSLRRQGRLWLDRLNDERCERARHAYEEKKVKPGFPVNSGFSFWDLPPSPLPLRKGVWREVFGFLWRDPFAQSYQNSQGYKPSKSHVLPLAL